MNFHVVSGHISPELQTSIVSSSSKSEAFFLYENIPLKNLSLCSLRPNADSELWLEELVIYL